MTKKNTLAIETAVGNGSLSLFENDLLLDEWSGETKIARSDQFLLILHEFLDRNKIKKRDLNLLAVSRGPGSFTGARVGLATALALKNGLGIPCLGVSVLRAMSLPEKQKCAAAILSDKNRVIRQYFAGDSILTTEPVEDGLNYNKPELIDLEEFISEINFAGKSASQNTNVFLNTELYKIITGKDAFNDLKNGSESKLNLEDCGKNLSAYIGRAAINNKASDNVQIIYLS